MATEKTTNVNTPTARYEELEKLRRTPRDVYGGLERLRDTEVAQTYLPRNTTESVANVPGVGPVDPWWNRVQMARLNNMLRDAVDDCVGRAFAKEAKPDKATPKDIALFCEDVDGMGTNLHVFGMAVASASTCEGEDFVLVDFPDAGGGDGMTQEQWDALHLAPFWRRYPAKSVIGWTFGRVGRRERLARVRLRETVTEVDGPWSTKTVEQVRVIYAGDPELKPEDPLRYARWQVWRKGGQQDGVEEWSPVAAGSMKPQVDIPLVDFPFSLAAQFESPPPFSDLAHLTVAHYRKTSDLDNAQHAVGFPLIHWGGGAIDPETKKPVGLGPDRLLVSADASGHVEFVEPQGTSWASLRAELTAMEANARELAAQPLTEAAPGNLTATGEAIRAARAASKLEAAVLGWQDSFSRLLYYTAILMRKVEYGAEDGWGGVELNRRFIPPTRDIEGLRIAKEMTDAGYLSRETLHEVAMAAEVVPATVDFNAEQKRLNESGPAPMDGLDDEPPGDDEEPKAVTDEPGTEKEGAVDAEAGVGRRG